MRRFVCKVAGALVGIVLACAVAPGSARAVCTGDCNNDGEIQVNELGIRAIKTYPGAGRDPEDNSTAIWPAPPWWVDDEAVSYPMIAEALRLGINIMNIHKGLRLGIFAGENIKPHDMPKAVRDWPDMNFVIYHSAGEYLPVKSSTT